MGKVNSGPSYVFCFGDAAVTKKDRHHSRGHRAHANNDIKSMQVLDN